MQLDIQCSITLTYFDKIIPLFGLENAPKVCFPLISLLCAGMYELFVYVSSH